MRMRAFAAMSALLPLLLAGQVSATPLDDARAAYQIRQFDRVETLLAPVVDDPANGAEALLLLGRAQVYQGKLEQARQSIRQAQARGLSGQKAREAELTLQYIAESLAETASVPRQATYQVTAYLRGEVVDGLARDASLSTTLTPKRESDFRARAGAALGGEVPLGDGATSVGVGLGVDELRYRQYRDFNEANVRASGRLLHRFSDLVVSSLSYDAQLTTIADHDQYALVHRVGTGTSFRHYRAADGSFSLVGRVGADVSFADYRTAHVLDSTTYALSLTEQVRFADPTTWIAPSLTWGTSDADTTQYSYSLVRLMLAGQTSLSNLGLSTEGWGDILLRGAVGRTWLDFRGRDSVQTAVARYDVQDSISMGLTKPLNSWTSLVLDASFSDNSSNLDRFDYQSTMLSTGVHFSF